MLLFRSDIQRIVTLLLQRFPNDGQAKLHRLKGYTLFNFVYETIPIVLIGSFMRVTKRENIVFLDHERPDWFAIIVVCNRYPNEKEILVPISSFFRFIPVA